MRTQGAAFPCHRDGAIDRHVLSPPPSKSHEILSAETRTVTPRTLEELFRQHLTALFFRSDRIEKSKALSLLLHTADISHPSKPWSLHSRWTKALMEEFFRQVGTWIHLFYLFLFLGGDKILILLLWHFSEFFILMIQYLCGSTPQPIWSAIHIHKSPTASSITSLFRSLGAFFFFSKIEKKRRTVQPRCFSLGTKQKKAFQCCFFYEGAKKKKEKLFWCVT